ncbi:MAG: response regulator, partial [Limisphaerales bacterium]
LARLQRLEGIGTLTRGLAHDLNNAFSAVLMGSALLRQQVSPEALRFVEGIEASAKRGSDLIRQLRSYVKGVEGERVLLDPRLLLREFEKSLRHTLPKSTTVQASYAPDTPLIFGEASMLQQALLRLSDHARTATATGAQIRIESCKTELDAKQAARLHLPPGEYATLRLRDTGPCLPPEVLTRIHEIAAADWNGQTAPGLGFAIAHAIAREHGGGLEIDSVPGTGTCATFHVPASKFVVTGMVSAALAAGAGRWVLLVDDEAPVRVTLRNHLQSLGFHVLEAADGPEALVKLATATVPVVLAVCDLHMPSLDGPSLCRWLRQIVPNLELLALSDALAKAPVEDVNALGLIGAINKPYTVTKLTGALQQLRPPA